MLTRRDMIAMTTAAVVGGAVGSYFLLEPIPENPFLHGIIPLVVNEGPLTKTSVSKTITAFRLSPDYVITVDHALYDKSSITHPYTDERFLVNDRFEKNDITILQALHPQGVGLPLAHRAARKGEEVHIYRWDSGTQAMIQYITRVVDIKHVADGKICEDGLPNYCLDGIISHDFSGSPVTALDPDTGEEGVIGVISAFDPLPKIKTADIESGPALVTPLCYKNDSLTLRIQELLAA